MSEMEYVTAVINRFIEELESQLEHGDWDALDESYYKCSIGTLNLLKSKLGII